MSNKSFYRIYSDQLIRDARDSMRRFRSVRLLDSADILLHDIPNTWGAGKDRLNSESIALAIAGRDKTYSGRHCDEKLMTDFMKNSEQGCMSIPDGMDRKAVIPGGTPLLDILIAHSEYDDAWKLPSTALLSHWGEKRGISTNIVKDVDTKEIVVGETSGEEIKEIAAWAEANFKRNQAETPTSALAIQVKQIPVSKFDIIRMAQKDQRGQEFELENSLNPPSRDEIIIMVDEQGNKVDNEWCYLPVKTLLGDGIGWQLVISLKMRVEGSIKIFTPSDIPDELLDMLEALPPLVGYDVKDQLTSWQTMVTKVYGKEVNIRRHIDLEVFSVLAGWLHHERSLTAISMMTLGVPINKASSRGDRLWGLKYEYLPTALQALVTSELKTVHMTYVVLLAALRQEVIPDPESLCYLTGERQTRVLRWWGSWISWITSDIAIYDKDLDRARTREEAITSLRAINENGRLTATPPYRIKMFAAVRRGGTTITRGGARYLHVERERLLAMYPVFAETKIKPFEAMFLKELNEEQLLYVRFGQHGIRQLDAKRPVSKGNSSRNLTFHPSLPLREISFKANHASIDELLDVFKQAQRPQREGLLEWARLNPGQVNTFFEVCNRNTAFSKKYRTTYEPLRLCVLRTMDTHPIEVGPCEDNLIGNLSSAIAQEEDKSKDLGERYAKLYDETCDLQDRLSKARKELKTAEAKYTEAEKQLEEVTTQMLQTDANIRLMKKTEAAGKNTNRADWKKAVSQEDVKQRAKRKRSEGESVKDRLGPKVDGPRGKGKCMEDRAREQAGPPPPLFVEGNRPEFPEEEWMNVVDEVGEED